MILNHDEILELIEAGGVVGSDPSLVNAASLDLCLGNMILFEMNPNGKEYNAPVISLRKREPMLSIKWDITNEGYILYPGEFILAHTKEVFNLPLDVSAQYHLKSSMGRIGLDHCLAGWCDAGWNGSVLTLELKNVSQHHPVELNYGDLIGQMVFHRHTTVRREDSYAARGRYNGDLSVEGMKQ